MTATITACAYDITSNCLRDETRVLNISSYDNTWLSNASYARILSHCKVNPCDDFDYCTQCHACGENQ